jgi:PAS domain S-box-containing protein
MVPIQKNGTERMLKDLDRYLAATLALLLSLDKEGVIFFISASATKLLGAEAERMIGRMWCETNLPPGLCQLFNEQNRAALQSGRSEKGEVPFPTVLGKRWFEYDISPVFDNEGKIEGTVVSVVDITQRKMVEEKHLRDPREGGGPSDAEHHYGAHA